jgi:hypothetical protein
LKRTILLLITLALLLIAGLSIVQAQTQDYPTTITVAAYIRSGPGVEYESYGVLLPGALFRVDGRNHNGNWVRGITQRGTVGWVDSGAIDITWNKFIDLVITDVNAPFLLDRPTADGTTPVMVEEPVDETEDAATVEDDVTNDVTNDVGTFGLQPNVRTGYEGGFPNGDFVGYQGEHAARFYPLISGEGVEFLHVYRIVGNEGWLIMSISPEDIAAYEGNPPAAPTLLKRDDGPGRYGPAELYILPDGTLQFNIGPDDEYRIQVLVFEGPASTNLIDNQVIEVNH